MTLDGEVVETTDEHPFYVVKTNDWLPLTQHGRWVEAGDLQPGDAILQADGETGAVYSVQVVAAPQWMYNLSVDVAHTFFVGQQQWLVHNCGGGASGKAKNKLHADTSAVGEHTTFKRDPQSRKVTGYETWQKSDPRNPNGWESQKRVDIQGNPHYDKSTGQDIPTPHVHESSGHVRPAQANEIPH